MLSLPTIISRPAQPYIAMRRYVTLPFNEVADATFPALFGWLDRHAIAPAGAPFIKYNVIDMARELEVEFGVATAGAVDPDAETVSGELPAGRYAAITWVGPYTDLMEVNAVLIGWARLHQYAFDMTETDRGDQFAGRFEIYKTDPAAEPDPSRWETELLIKLKEG